MEAETDLPCLFGVPARLALLDEEGLPFRVIGGPAHLEPDRWRFIAFAEPSALRRRLAREIVGVLNRPRDRRGPWFLEGGLLGYRTTVGHVLLAMDGDGWYVAGVAATVSSRSAAFVLNELRRGVELVRERVPLQMRRGGEQVA